MPKPSIIPRWGETGGGSAGPNNTEPSSGTKDVGFVAGTPTVANYVNWLLFAAYQWFKYLDAGALSGNHTVDGTFGVTGAVDFDSNLNCDGNAVVDGTMSVGGDINSATGDLNLTAGYVKHDLNEYTHIHGSSFQATQPQVDAVLVSAQGISPTAGPVDVYASIPILRGRRIGEMNAMVTTSTEPGTRRFQIWRKTWLGGATSALETATFSTISTSTEMQLVNNVEIEDGYYYTLKVELLDGDILEGVEIVWDFPV